MWGVYSLKSNCTFHLAIPLTFTSQRIIIQSNLSRRKGKPTICIGENKGAEQLRSYFAFATRIVKFIFVLNLKFPSSNHLLRLYMLVCVGPGRNPNCCFLTHWLICNLFSIRQEVFVDFEFEFYGHIIKRIYLSTAGKSIGPTCWPYYIRITRRVVLCKK